MEDEKYTLLVARDYSEEQLRQIWHDEYCTKELYSFDSIRVHFYDSNFDYAFYESSGRNDKTKHKDVLSLQRLARIRWIKDVLMDKDAKLYVGYDSKTKSYNKSRRVAVVKGNYVVIILIYADKQAKFITAYVADNSIGKIVGSPEWK